MAPYGRPYRLQTLAYSPGGSTVHSPTTRVSEYEIEQLERSEGKGIARA